MACTMESLAKMPDAKPIVFVVDDDVSVRESLDALIQVAGWEPRAFSSARAFLAGSPVRGASCLVLDVNLPDLNGLELQAMVTRERTDMPIIFISGYGDVAKTVQAMKAGAVEFLTKPLDKDTLLDAIRAALERSRAALGESTALQAIRERYASLTSREREVMALIIVGLLNKQVGGKLGISDITVKAHRGRVMEKMHANSLAQLVHFGAKLGLAPPPD
jgi:FixJ family two-component response regulator